MLHLHDEWRTCVAATLVMIGLVACETHRGTLPHVEIDAVAEGLDAFLRRHPMAPDDGIRADPVHRTEQASWHLVQVRAAETPHRHADHDLQVVILRGGGDLHLGDRTIALGRGDVALIPHGAMHWFANAGDEPAVALVTYVPPAPPRR
jgi:mannose-6-phosphate isomerase-like protein (cupin superfamily)